MKKLCVVAAVAVIAALFVSCNKDNNQSAGGTESFGSVTEGSFDSGNAKNNSGDMPAVNLLDNVYIWEADGSNLADKPLKEILDIGSAITFSGKEQKFGKEQYTYAKIKTPKGTEGWVSAYRLAENAIPVVVTDDTFLYSLPDEANPTAVQVHAGQIAGAYIDVGKINGFAKISYCVYYGNQNYSDRYNGFVKTAYLSQNRKDLDCAQFMVRAVENPAQWKDFAKFALDSKSTFVSQASGYANNAVAVAFDGKILPTADALANGQSVSATTTIVAIQVVADGKFVPWYAADVDGSTLLLKVDPAEGAVISKASNTSALSLSNNTVTGNSVVILQDLAIKKENEDDSKKLDWMGSLNLGEVVNATGNTKTVDKVDYVEIERCDGTKGWANSTYVIVDSYPAAIGGSSEVKLFKEPKKLSIIANTTVPNYQVVAVNSNTESGWYSISYYDQGAKRLRSEVYISTDDEFDLATGAKLSAAILLNKLRATENEKYKDENVKRQYQTCLATLIEKQGSGFIAESEYAKYKPAVVVISSSEVYDDSSSTSSAVTNSGDDTVVVTTEDVE
jgi:hypothetical protein